tara:strand:- start:27 stop:1046 length:1020 start_codon:yes stop_codon:yes gene_type:complete
MMNGVSAGLGHEDEFIPVMRWHAQPRLDYVRNTALVSNVYEGVSHVFDSNLTFIQVFNNDSGQGSKVKLTDAEVSNFKNGKKFMTLLPADFATEEKQRKISRLQGIHQIQMSSLSEMIIVKGNDAYPFQNPLVGERVVLPEAEGIKEPFQILDFGALHSLESKYTANFEVDESYSEESNSIVSEAVLDQNWNSRTSSCNIQKCVRSEVDGPKYQSGMDARYFLSYNVQLGGERGTQTLALEYMVAAGDCPSKYWRNSYYWMPRAVAECRLMGLKSTNDNPLLTRHRAGNLEIVQMTCKENDPNNPRDMRKWLGAGAETVPKSNPQSSENSNNFKNYGSL